MGSKLSDKLPVLKQQLLKIEAARLALLLGTNRYDSEGWAPARPPEKADSDLCQGQRLAFLSFPSALPRHDLTTVTGDSAKVSRWPQDSDRSEFGAQ